MPDVLPTSTPKLQTSSSNGASMRDHDVGTILASLKSFCDGGFQRQAEESTKQQQVLNQLLYCVDQHHVRLARLQDDHLELKLSHEKQLAEMRNSLFYEVGLIRKDLNTCFSFENCKRAGVGRHFATLENSRELEENIQQKEDRLVLLEMGIEHHFQRINQTFEENRAPSRTFESELESLVIRQREVQHEFIESERAELKELRSELDMEIEECVKRESKSGKLQLGVLENIDIPRREPKLQLASKRRKQRTLTESEAHEEDSQTSSDAERAPNSCMLEEFGARVSKLVEDSVNRERTDREMQLKEVMRLFDWLCAANADLMAGESDLHSCLQNYTPLELHNNAQDKLNISYKELETRLTAVQEKQKELAEGERAHLLPSQNDLMSSHVELSTSLKRDSRMLDAKLAAFSGSLDNDLEQRFAFLRV